MSGNRRGRLAQQGPWLEDRAWLTTLEPGLGHFSEDGYDNDPEDAMTDQKPKSSTRPVAPSPKLSPTANVRDVATFFEDASDVSARIEDQALETAALQCAQGWTPEAGPYELGAMAGDREALDVRLGRKATRGERFAFEARVRELLALSAPFIKNEPAKSTLVRWQDVTLWSATEGYSMRGDEKTGLGIPMLSNYRQDGSLDGWWLADPNLYDDNCKPLSGEGPDLASAGPAVDEIDWTGFAFADDVAKLAKKLRSARWRGWLTVIVGAMSTPVAPAPSGP